jgi:hypothetical protein
VLELAEEVPVGQRGEEQTGQILRAQSSSMAEIQVHVVLEHKLVLEALPTGTLVEMQAQGTVNHSLELVPVQLERVLQYLRRGLTAVVRQRVGFELELKLELEQYSSLHWQLGQQLKDEPEVADNTPVLARLVAAHTSTLGVPNTDPVVVAAAVAAVAAYHTSSPVHTVAVEGIAGTAGCRKLCSSQDMVLLLLLLLQVLLPHSHHSTGLSHTAEREQAQVKVIQEDQTGYHQCSSQVQAQEQKDYAGSVDPSWSTLGAGGKPR